MVHSGHTDGRQRGCLGWLLTGSPPVPQLMRMVLREALTVLQTQGWDERWVPQPPVLLTPIAGWSLSFQTEGLCFLAHLRPP